MVNEPPPSLPPGLLRECHGSRPWLHVVRGCWFAVLYLLAASGAVMLAAKLDSPWQCVLGFPLYLVAAAALHGISLFTHEAVHGTLSKNRWWNAVAGSLCA